MSKVKNLKLERAIKKRNEFLKENPQLQQFQNDLEEQFEAMGNDPFVNMQIIRHHMQHNLLKLERIKDEIKTKTEKLH